MKIALAIETFSVHAGGAESYAVRLAHTLIAEGWEVHLFGHSWDGDPPGAVFHKIRRLSGLVPASLRILDFAFEHRKQIADHDFDVVLGFGNTLAMNVYQSHGGVHYRSNLRKLEAEKNRALRTIKTLLLFVSPKYHARAWIESAPFRAKNTPEIIAISDMVRSDMAAHFGIEQDRIRLIYNGIDVSRFAEARSNDERSELRSRLGFHDEVLFLFMAYDFRKKGVRDLVEASALLKGTAEGRRFGVVVVGGPPSRNLTRCIARSGLERTVVFPGPTKRPESYYAACDVFTLPTYYDACSLVVFEAMAAGLPVVTTAWNGAAGAMSSGHDGIVLDRPGRPHELARAMKRFLDREELRRFSENARDTASRYTIEENHRRMLNVLHEVAAGRRNPEPD